MEKINIEISKETQMLLDNLRREIVSVISRNNDLEIMKKVEKCDYNKLIYLLNIGFSEKHFYDALAGKMNLSMEDIIYTDTSREVLKKVFDSENL